MEEDESNGVIASCGNTDFKPVEEAAFGCKPVIMCKYA